MPKKGEIESERAEKGEETRKKHRIIIFISILVVLLLIIFFATKAYLYVNFLLGNDIVVKLATDKEDYKLTRGEEKNISFEAKVTTNPFCKARCTSKFEDISSREILKNEEFTLTPASPLTLSYKIRVDEFGEGQKLYRQSLDCKSESTLFCHTSGDATSRTILITAEYNLTEEEKALKDALKETLDRLQKNITEAIILFNSSQQTIRDLAKNLILDDLKTEAEDAGKSIESSILILKNLEAIWETQDYANLKKELDNSIPKIEGSSKIVQRMYKDTSDAVNGYNFMVLQAKEAKAVLESLNSLKTENQEIIDEIAKTADDFNSIVETLEQKDLLEYKESLADSLSVSAKDSYDATTKSIKSEALKRAISLDIEFETLCILESDCIKRPGINEREAQADFELEEACSDAEKINKIYQSIQTNETDGDNSTALLNSLHEYIIVDFINSLEGDKINSEEIENFLLSLELGITPSVPEQKDFPKILAELSKREVSECRLKSINISLREVNMTGYTIKNLTAPNISIIFAEPKEKCCVFGKCEDCCKTFECQNNPEDYPIVFIHGHSINKQVAADYSLDAFNRIQKRLEEDGYLNAGVISLYTPPDIEQGTWGFSGVPLSIKASYYFDIFEEPQNYVVVQTKSENIDTYAIRLNDIINTIKYRTGRPKVVIIAHSMGGLVTRRYIQIFGPEDIDKLIMIGTPNKGIEGRVADFCPIVGENLECRDMSSESLFINKVNREKIPQSVKVYNIVGSGCDMKGDDGDGVVILENSKLDYTNNYVINGSCRGLFTLHTDLLNIDKYPKVYDIIKEALGIKEK